MDKVEHILLRLMQRAAKAYAMAALNAPKNGRYIDGYADGYSAAYDIAVEEQNKLTE